MSSASGDEVDLDRPPAKRVRLSQDEEPDGVISGNTYGPTLVHGSGPVHLGNYIQYTAQHCSHKQVDTSADKLEILLRSLLFDRIDFRVNNVKKALSSTCEWLFRHRHFQSWNTNDQAKEHSGFLWIKGKPGCGKSTLMKTALEWKRRWRGKQDVKSILVPYFFNARAPTSLEKSRLGLYRTVVHHLLSSCPSLQQLFLETFGFKQPETSGNDWTAEELENFLCNAIESGESFALCLFIDALDEAEHEDDVRKMITFLIELSDRALGPESLCKLQICLSSRHYPHITIGRGLSFVVEDQPEHSQDIDTYVTRQLAGDESSEKDELKAEVCRKSASVFLWVVLVVDLLNTRRDQGASLPDMKALVHTLPADLNELFKEILFKNIHGIETSIVLFQWVVFGLRALEPEELFVAMEYSRSPGDPSWRPPPEIEKPSPDRLARYILNCSRGLVEVTTSNPPVVQFIHETVREFLIGKYGLASIVPALSACLHGLSHDVLKVGCLRCVTANSIPGDYEQYCKDGHRYKANFEEFKERLRERLPFLDYAVLHLFEHAEQAQKHDIPQRSFLQLHTDESGVLETHHRSWWNILQQHKTNKYSAKVTLLYYLVDQGCTSLLSALLSSSEVNSVINVRCGRYYSALFAAIVNGNFVLVPLLRRHGASLPGALLRKLIFEVVERKSHEGVALALELGADPNATERKSGLLNRRPRTVLQAASFRGHLEVVRLLLDRGADVNAQGGGYGNALQTASSRGSLEVVRLLLDRGADVNAQGGRYGNALQAASLGGCLEVVRLLLDRGADVNAEGGKYSNALHAASEGRSLEEVRLLLDRGADVNAQGGHYGNALQAASRNGRLEVVRLLLDRGADVNAQGGHYGNALQAASTNGRLEVVRLLLDRGADVNAEGGNYSNALQAAYLGGSLEVVRLLLDRGADVNAEGGKYGNALQAASWNGMLGVVRLLLDHGANVNAQGGPFGNTLQAASGGGNLEVVRLLLDRGADVNAQAGRYGNALQAAAASWRGSLEVVRLLLDHGANVNAQGGVHETALKAAVAWDWHKIAQVLRDHGATV